ncbi:DUF2993 domain-containing protein [Pseudactinotalea sp.]|uniref:LmeA family phospholipid-binding protein n=1 Tax=Pseudactinotalea sp. TaxID=1926260 RepID=UPI003B3AF7AE
MKQRGRVKSFIAVLIALGILVGAGYLGDRWVRSEIESRAESTILDAVPGLDAELDAELGGRFATPQLIAGELETITITSPAATIDGFTLTDVHIVATGVPIRGSGSVDEVHATATAPIETVLAAVERRVDLPEGVTLELRDGEIAAVATVLGVELEAYVTLAPQPRSITIELDRLVLGGATVSAADVPLDLSGLLGVTAVDLDMLPEGLEVTELEVTPGGIDVVLAGSGISI